MIDFSFFVIDVDRLLMSDEINLEEARDVLVFCKMKELGKTQKVFIETIEEYKKTIANMMDQAIEKKQFSVSQIHGELFHVIDETSSGYRLKGGNAPTKEILEWARNKGLLLPDNQDEKNDKNQQALASQKQESKLSGNEKREFARLKVEKDKWDDSIMAAFSAGLFCSSMKENGDVLTRKAFSDRIYEAGYKTLPDTTINKIWNALPPEIKSKGGRPKGCKDVH